LTADSAAPPHERGGWVGPLADVPVVDLTRVLAGPFAAQSPGNLGADVM